MSKRKDYRDILKKILEEHPEIAAINIEYKMVDRLTLGNNTPAYGVTQQIQDKAIKDAIATVGGASGYVSPSGLRPIVPKIPTPEELVELRNGAHVEEVKILNAPQTQK